MTASSPDGPSWESASTPLTGCADLDGPGQDGLNRDRAESNQQDGGQDDDGHYAATFAACAGLRTPANMETRLPVAFCT